MPQDFFQSERWYRQAAEQGNAWAQYNLGMLFQNGYAVSGDRGEGRKWIRRAARQGYMDPSPR